MKTEEEVVEILQNAICDFRDVLIQTQLSLEDINKIHAAMNDLLRTVIETVKN